MICSRDMLDRSHAVGLLGPPAKSLHAISIPGSCSMIVGWLVTWDLESVLCWYPSTALATSHLSGLTESASCGVFCL